MRQRLLTVIDQAVPETATPAQTSSDVAKSPVMSTVRPIDCHSEANSRTTTGAKMATRNAAVQASREVISPPAPGSPNGVIKAANIIRSAVGRRPAVAALDLAAVRAQIGQPGRSQHVQPARPERIVLGGELSQAADLLIEPMQDVISRHGIPSATRRVQIVQAALSSRSQVLGAVALALRAPTDRPHRFRTSFRSEHIGWLPHPIRALRTELRDRQLRP
ncbi:MAG TPA: hypothetical protein VNP92_10400 [Actinophytocola sp.]|nr:hypothetical protein [Actinophytocola sp.]